ncbi:MAG: hypothetical protein K2O44_02355 [Clostridia bacterium]|nr:hypothetical protein [Clostridia bacterium]
MQKYLNLGGNSYVEAFEIRPTYISVKFYGTSKIYTYSYKSAGSLNVETAKTLARSGSGLNSFIMRNMRTSYEK